MHPELFRDLADQQGPFASVYLDVSRDHQAAPREVRLRWQELRRYLRGADADPATVDAIGAVVAEPTEQPGPAGRALIAAGGRVLVDAPLPGPPRRPIARWSVLPHLMPLLAQTVEAVPAVTVQLGKVHALVRGFDRAGREVFDASEHGRHHPVHKVRGGGEAHYGMRQRTEETWKDNARAFAADVDRAVEALHAELVVLIGDTGARRLLADALDERNTELAVDLAGPGPDDTTTDGEFSAQVRRLAAERALGHTERALEDFAVEAAKPGGAAATGLAPVVRALQLNQARTVIVRDDPSSDLQMWVGPEPPQLGFDRDEVRELAGTVLGQDRADAALVRAVAGTGADLVLLRHPEADSDPRRAGSAAGGAGPAKNDPELVDGIGAVLRFVEPR